MAAAAPAPQAEIEEPSLFAQEEPAPTFTRAATVAQEEAAAPASYHDQAEAAQVRAPGAPSPEALARLEAAVRKVPETYAEEPAAPTEAERPRFGINSLINRMTGAQDEANMAPRKQPPFEAVEEEADPEQERIEIPAFLRRQAN